MTRASCRDARGEHDALAALRGERPDLALLDMLMRENAGLDIEALAAELGVPVLRMSGHPDIIRRSEEQGVPILAKPFRIGDLVAKVDRLLVEAQRLRQGMEEHVEAGRQLVGKCQADAATARIPQHDASKRWQQICRRVLKDATG